jgi:hypothetical protein
MLLAMARKTFWGSLGKIKRVRRCMRERGVREAEKARRLRLDLTRIWSFELPIMADDGEDFCSLAASIGKGKREQRERRVDFIAGGGLMRLLGSGREQGGVGWCAGFQGRWSGGWRRRC